MVPLTGLERTRSVCPHKRDAGFPYPLWASPVASVPSLVGSRRQGPGASAKVANRGDPEGDWEDEESWPCSTPAAVELASTNGDQNYRDLQPNLRPCLG